MFHHYAAFTLQKIQKELGIIMYLLNMGKRTYKTKQTVPKKRLTWVWIFGYIWYVRKMISTSQPNKCQMIAHLIWACPKPGDKSPVTQIERAASPPSTVRGTLIFILYQFHQYKTRTG